METCDKENCELHVNLHRMNTKERCELSQLANLYSLSHALFDLSF